MPNPLLQALLNRFSPSPQAPPQPQGDPMLALQKASSIGTTSPMMDAINRVGGVKSAAMPPPGGLMPSLTGLGKIAVPSLTRGARVAETLGEMSPEFTPVGGEWAHNITRPGAMGMASALPKPEPGADNLLRLLTGR